jgi:hypothetical protein
VNVWIYFCDLSKYEERHTKRQERRKQEEAKENKKNAKREQHARKENEKHETTGRTQEER